MQKKISKKSDKKIFIFIILFLLLSSSFQKILAQSQILDDTTKQVYGTNTTFLFKEIDILDDTQKKYKLDTSLNNFHHFTIVQKSGYQYQDLGSWGTSLRPIYFQTPHEIGARIGIDVYRPYLPTPENIDYYDTKSPFIRLNYVQGTTGDQSINFIYARNVNKRLSFAFNYKRTNANKVYGADNTRDILADQTALYVSTQYESKSKKYKLLFHYAHLNQIVNEQGGIIKNGELPDSGRFAYRESAAKLGSTARNWQTHNNFHLYQQYKIGEGLVGFVISDANRQRDAYGDAFRDSTALANRVDYYPNIGVLSSTIGRLPLYHFSNTSTDESTIYWQFDNKIGWKGRWRKFNYQVYYKNRIYDFYLKDRKLKFAYEYDNSGNIIASRNISPNLGEGVQNFIGGKLFLQLKDSTRLTLEAEHLLGKDYQIKADFQSKWFTARGKSMLYSPSLLEQKYVSNHFIWNNPNFSNVFVNEVETEAFWNNKFLLVKPFLNYQVIGNFIYFDEKSLPKQTNDILQMSRIGAYVELKFGKFRLAQQGTFFQNIGANTFRAPTLNYTGRIFCQDCLYKKRIESQIGIEANYKSDYFGNGFMAIAKQYHLQNTRNIQGFWYLETFMNVKIGNFRIFGKFINLLNFNRSDYRSFETTPDYPALPFTFTFGIDWMFFN